jgi:hypothetical protein
MTKKRQIALAAVVIVCAGLVAIAAYRVPEAPPAGGYVRQMELQREVLASWRKQDREGDVRSPFHFLLVTATFKQFATKHLGSLKDLNVVEIRPGSSMIPGALYIGAGAKHFYAVDIFEHRRSTMHSRTAPRSIWQSWIRIISCATPAKSS